MINKKKTKTIANETFNLEDTEIFKKVKSNNLNFLLTGVFILFLGALAALGGSAVLIFSVPLLLAAVYIFFISYSRNENYFDNPDLKKFFKFGDNYANFIKLLDNEIKSEIKAEFSKCFFTTSFLVSPTTYRFYWFHFSEIVWAYVHRTDNYSYFIKTGSDFKVVVNFDDGTTSEFTCNEEESKKIMENILSISPFAFIGFDETLKESGVKTNKT